MSDKYQWQIGAEPPVLDDHSAAKHRIVRDYTRRYIEVLTADPRHDALTLTLVDGFAGGGEYRYRGRRVSGSPMILLEEAACAQVRFNAERTKPFALRAEHIFVDSNPSNMAYLTNHIRNSPYAPGLGQTIHLVQDEFNNRLDEIIGAVRRRGAAQRSIFLLDQYGYSDVSFAAVRAILTQLANPEIILTFSVDSIIDYLSENPSFLKAVLPIDLGLAEVQAMLAMKDQREARWLIENFLYDHLMKRTGAPFYTCFFIKSPDSHRSYWLVHISKHPKARDEMAGRHWENQNHFIHHGRPGLHMLGFDGGRNELQIPLDFMFDDNAEKRSKTALMTDLPPYIFDRALGGGEGVTLEGLFARVCNSTPATVQHISGALADLRAEGEIEIVSKDGSARPRTRKFQWSDVILPATQRSMFSAVWPLRRSG